MAFWNWSRTAGSNGASDPTINWQEGMPPGQVNDSARAMMARLAEYRDDSSGLLVTSGTSSAFTVATNQGLPATPDDGQLIAVSPHAANAAGATLAADGGTAYPLQLSPGSAINSGLFVIGAPIMLKFNLSALAWIVVGLGSVANPPTGFSWVAAGGTSDAITATYSPVITTLVDGQLCFFRATATNATSTPTFSPNGLTAEVITKDGGLALSVGDIPGALAEVVVRYNLANTRWELMNPAVPVQGILEPQGRLTLTSGTPVITGDVIGATSVFYTPFAGNLCPIYNGGNFQNVPFSQQTLSLVSNHVADAVYDVFAFFNGTSFTIGTGPAWTSLTARGSGAGTTQLGRLNGFLTNAVSITARNGSSTFAVAANQGTYLGSIYIDHTAGQVTCHLSYGQNRKWGVFNAYISTRAPAVLQCGDPTSSWTYNSATVRASNASPASYAAASFNVGSGVTCNGCAVLTGLSEEEIDVTFNQVLSSGQLVSSPGPGNGWEIGIGVNSTTVFTGKNGLAGAPNNWAADISGGASVGPALGVTNIACLESATHGSAATFFGTTASMRMRVLFRA